MDRRRRTPRTCPSAKVCQPLLVVASHGQARIPAGPGPTTKPPSGSLASQQRGDGRLACAQVGDGAHVGRVGVACRTEPGQFDRAADVGQ